jgi:AcrR family transcriptional regulator
MAVARELIDLLWRHDPRAPGAGSRGPKSKVSVDQIVDVALGLADAGGLDSVTVRRVAQAVGMVPMSLYTHVASREDLLVLMADAALREAPAKAWSGTTWREQVTQVAEENLALGTVRPWLLDIGDQRIALGPGAIAKYDRELQAFEGLGLTDLDRDAALTFVLDFAWAAARAMRPQPGAPDMVDTWARWQERLAQYLGADYPLARRVGSAAGESMNAAYSPDHAWRFGLTRVLDSLSQLRQPS